MRGLVAVSAPRRGLTGLLWIALLCWAGVILYLSSLPPDELPDLTFKFWDKAQHVFAFAIGGVLAALALRASYPRMAVIRVGVRAVLLIAAFGVLDEALQTMTPGRTGADLTDWAADVLGATAGALLVLRGRSST